MQASCQGLQANLQAYRSFFDTECGDVNCRGECQQCFINPRVTCYLTSRYLSGLHWYRPRQRRRDDKSVDTGLK